MTTPLERQFAVFRRGQNREDILAAFRNGLRVLLNPKTSDFFTEDEIRRATTPGSRFYIEADAIDLVTQGIQKRDEFLAQQARIDRAGSAFLRNYHAPQWGEDYLPATGGSGYVTALGTPGTTWTGSLVLGDPTARFARDDAGNRYQVLVTDTANGSGVATLLLVGIDGGEQTNIEVGTVLTWGNPPAGSQPTCTVVDNDFVGGGPAETDAEFSKRLSSRVARKPGSGNEAQIRALARASSNSVEDAFPYPCAMNAGSTPVAVLQKRRSGVGPDARLPSLAVQAAVTALIVPPGSPQIPARAFIVVLVPVAQPSNVVVQLAQKKGSASGWADVQPFPPMRAGGVAVSITTVTSQTNFRVTTDGAGDLPNGVTGPLAGVELMVWDVPSSRFEVLNVNTVEDLGAGVYRIILGSAPTHTLALGDWVSPAMARNELVAESTELYFDSLGPGELVDPNADVLAVRAFRRPPPTEEWPQRAGQTLTTFLREGLGGSISDALVASMSETEPDIPADPIDGPSLITLGKFAVYDID